MLAIDRLQRELLDCHRGIRAGSLPYKDLSPREEEQQDPFVWDILLKGPSDTPYVGGTFRIGLTFPLNYPFGSPEVRFKTRIYHCNISAEGIVCMDILMHLWTPALTAEKLLLSISLLLTEPNPFEALNRTAAQAYIRDSVEYRLTAQEWARKYSAEEWALTSQLVLTLFCEPSDDGIMRIRGMNLSGSEAVSVIARPAMRVSELYLEFCLLLGRSLETVTLVLPEGPTSLEALRDVTATKILSERRLGVNFEELLQRNISERTGQPYDYVLSRSAEQWEELPIAFDTYTIQEIFGASLRSSGASLQAVASMPVRDRALTRVETCVSLYQQLIEQLRLLQGSDLAAELLATAEGSQRAFCSTQGLGDAHLP